MAASAGNAASAEDSYSDPGQEADVRIAGPDFVAALASVLTHLASFSGRPHRVTRFHAVRAPQLSILDYLVRIATYFHCSNECFVLGLVYIDRIVKRHPEFTVSNCNVHRLLVTSVMLAAKFFDDVYYSNDYYARVGGIKVQEMNALEVLFLKLIDYRLYVKPQEYEQYRNHVLTAVRGSSSSSPSAQSRLGGTSAGHRTETAAAGTPSTDGPDGGAPQASNGRAHPPPEREGPA